MRPEDCVRLLHMRDADDAGSDLSEVEHAWEDEIRRRLAEVDAGTAELIPAEDVFAELRRRRAALEDECDTGEPWETVLDQTDARDG